MTATMTGAPQPPQPSNAEVAAPKRNLIFTAVLHRHVSLLDR
jgi:hypothetical protein